MGTQSVGRRLPLDSPDPQCQLVDPAQIAAIFEKPDAVLAREIGAGESGGGAYRKIESGKSRGAGLRQRIEQEYDIGIAFLLELGHVELAASQRGAPVDVPNPVARQERADIAGLDPLAELRRDVVPE